MKKSPVTEGDEVHQVRRRPRLIWSMIVLAGMVAVAVGVSVGLALAPGPVVAPDVAATSGKTFVGISQSTFDDPVDVDLVVKSAGSRPLVSAVTGTVTSSSCRVGGVLHSGDVLARVDGSPVIVLATQVPLWRDLRPGDAGDDVAALQRQLRVLGYRPSSGGRLDSATARAVRALLTSKGWGVAAPGAPVLPRAGVVWMSHQQQTMASCLAAVGDTLTAGQPLATVAIGATQIAPKNALAVTVAGVRTVTVGHVTVPVDAQGVVNTAADVATLLATEQGRLWQDSKGEVPLRGHYALAKPLTVWSVPPAALIDAAGPHPCVLDDQGSFRSVTVVSSILGRSLVSPSGPGASAPGRVLVDVTGGRTCG